MKAAVVRGGDVAIADIPEPSISNGEILVETRVCGVCGTDLYKLRSGTVPDGTVLGHELSGVVIESRVERLAKGDRVFVPHHVPCAKCRMCLRGHQSMCDTFKVNCMDPGGFAQVVRVTEPSSKWGIEKIGPEMSFRAASLIEPLACCVRSVVRSGMHRGDAVLVVGAGQTGAYHILVLSALGAGKIIACDIDSGRLEQAKALGASGVVDASAGDVGERIASEADGNVDVAFVTSESPAAFRTAVDAISDGGTVVMFAHGEDEFCFDPNPVLKGEKTITTSYSSTPEDHGTVMKAMNDGKIDVGRIGTLSFSMDEAQDAVEAARSRKALRVILEMEGRL